MIGSYFRVQIFYIFRVVTWAFFTDVDKKRTREKRCFATILKEAIQIR